MIYTYTPELYHHGVKGQQWGVRRYQNADGSLTDEGYRHWGLKKEYHGFNAKGKQALAAIDAAAKFKKEAKKKGYSDADTKKFMNEMSKQMGDANLKQINKAATSKGNARVMKYMAVAGVAGLAVSAIATGGLATGAIAGATQFGIHGGAASLAGALTAYGKNASDEHRRNKVIMDIRKK